MELTWGIHIPYTNLYPIQWGASWSYLEFPNHLIDSGSGHGCHTSEANL